MPLFTFQCRDCNCLFEALVASSEKRTLRCRQCGGLSRRHSVSAFRVGGRRPTTGKGALQATGSDFISNPDSFVSAMDSFGDRIGDRLTNRQMEKAVEQIKTIRR